MQKYSNKILANQIQEHQKDHPPLSSSLHARDLGMVQYKKMCQSNLPFKQTEGK